MIDTLHKIIDQSTLDIEDKENLKKLFSSAPEEVLKYMIDLFSKDPEALIIISENYKNKKNLSPSNLQAWSDITAKEEKLLSTIE